MITVVCIQQYRIEASNMLVALIAATIKVIARRHVFFLQLSLSPPFPILDWQIVGVKEMRHHSQAFHKSKGSTW